MVNFELSFSIVGLEDPPRTGSVILNGTSSVFSLYPKTGKIIKEGSPGELTMQLGQSGLSVHLSGWDDRKKEILDDFTFTYDGGRLHFSLLDPEKEMATIIKILTKNDCYVQSVSADKASLEDVFLDLTGDKIN